MQYEKQDNERSTRLIKDELLLRERIQAYERRDKMINRIGAVMIAMATGLSLIMVIRALGGL